MNLLHNEDTNRNDEKNSISSISLQRMMISHLKSSYNVTDQQTNICSEIVVNI